MNRRKFLNLGLGVAAATMIPATLSATNFRKTKPAAWTAHKANAAMKELFGTSKTTAGKVKLKVPAIAENGAVVPVHVSSKLAGSTVAIFQDANPETTVAVITVPENGIIDYKFRIKMAKTGKISAVVNVDGKLYSNTATVKVTAGGCGG